jgi:hypothetical protein
LHLNEVRYCYEQALGTAPELAGRVALRIIIGSDGKVTESSIASSTLGNANVEGCVAKAGLGWQFPRVEGGGLVIVSYPFNFLPRPAAQTTPIPVTSGRRRRPIRGHRQRARRRDKQQGFGDAGAAVKEDPWASFESLHS